MRMLFHCKTVLLKQIGKFLNKETRQTWIRNQKHPPNVYLFKVPIETLEKGMTYIQNSE